MLRSRVADSSLLAFSAGFVLCLTLIGCNRDPAKVCAQALARADRYTQQEQIDKAIIEYKNAIKADPRSVEARLKLGNAYMKTSQLREAYQQFQQVLSFSPNNRDALLAIGQIYLQAGMLDEARQTASMVLAQNAKDVDARLLIANTDASRGMVSAAISELESLAKEQPNLTGVHINLGMLYATMRRNDLAESELQKAIALEPSSFNARKALAALYLTTNRIGQAEEIYRAAAKDAPNSAEVQLTLAQFFVLQNRLSEAEQIYKSVIQIQKNSPHSRLALASFYIQQHRFEEARKLDEQILADNGDFYQARLQLAELALKDGDINRANATIAPLLKENVRNHDTQVVQARILLAEHKPQQAADVLENSLRQGDSPATRYLLGVAYSEIGNLQRAESELKSCVNADPGFLDAYIALAQMMLARGNPKESLQYSRIAMERAPDRPELALLTGNAYADMGQYANAEKSFQAYVTAMPHSTEGLNRLGLLNIAQHRGQEAIQYFEKALQLDPTDYEALDGIISTLILSGAKDKATQRINAELARQSSPELLNIAGKGFTATGDYDSAELNLQKALSKSPDNFASYVLLGSLYTQKKNVPEAIQHYEAALKLRRNDVGLLTMLGVLYQGQNNLDRSLEMYNRALDVDPNLGVAANNLAWIYADHVGDMDRALEYARRAKVALPNVPNVTDTLGWIYTRRQLYDMAVPLLREAVKSTPQNAEYRFHLAVALYRGNRKPEATQLLSSALKLDPALKKRNEAQEIMRAQ